MRGALALFLLTCTIMALAVCLSSHVAYSRADFDIWNNRSTRVIEPVGFCTKGTCTEKIVSWNGTRGIGNVGIGNGDINLMKPDYLKEALNVTGNAAGGEAPAPLAHDFETEDLLPLNIMAGSVIEENEPQTIVLGHPFPHIFMENPVEPSVLYGKLLGLPMPDGSRVDYGIKCLGYEY